MSETIMINSVLLYLKTKSWEKKKKRKKKLPFLCIRPITGCKLFLNKTREFGEISELFFHEEYFFFTG